MSAVVKVGDFVIDCDPRYDEEKELFYINAGIKTKHDMVLHITAYGKSGEVATARAEWYCRICTMVSTKNIKSDTTIEDILSKDLE
jgi:hypothetical protein